MAGFAAKADISNYMLFSLMAGSPDSSVKIARNDFGAADAAVAINFIQLHIKVEVFLKRLKIMRGIRRYNTSRTGSSIDFDVCDAV